MRWHLPPIRPLVVLKLEAQDVRDVVRVEERDELPTTRTRGHRLQRLKYEVEHPVWVQLEVAYEGLHVGDHLCRLLASTRAGRLAAAGGEL